MAEVEIDKSSGGGQPNDDEDNSVGQNGLEKGNGASVIAPSTFVFGQNMESRVLKRPAENQLDRQKAEEEDVKPDELPGEFPKASPNVIAQRPLVTARKDPSMDFLAENEDSNSNPFVMTPTKSFIKPSAFLSSRPFSCIVAPNTAASNPFKLKPATLPPPSSQINGQGSKGETIEASHSVTSNLINEPPTTADIEQSQTKEKEDETDSTSEMTTTTIMTTATTTTTVKQSSEPQEKNIIQADSPKSHDKNTEEIKTNYFIKLSRGTARDSGFGVFGKFSHSTLRIPEASQSQQAASDNYFLQFAPNPAIDGKEDKSEPAKSLVSSGSLFMFGQNLTDRVTSPSKQEGELKAASEYVFGENLTERVKGEETKESLEAKGPTLAESASAYEEARENQRLKLDKVPQVNGEEDEENVLQAQCKLYLFDSTTHSWLEKGRGLLRLNDKTQKYASHFHSRLVMRTQGSLRVVLNTKVWTNMTVEKASPKSIRITAMDSENKIRVFLIVTEPNHADQIFTAIDYRVQALQYAEQKKVDREQESAKKVKQLTMAGDECNEDGQKTFHTGMSDEKESQASDESSPSPPPLPTD